VQYGEIPHLIHCETLRTTLTMPAPWHALWCYERSGKYETGQLRRRLVSSVSKFNGVFISVKKAKDIDPHLTAVSCPVVVMLDWREAKPFAGMLARLPACRHPVAVAIHCPNEVSKDRACRWTNRQAIFTIPFTVCGGLNDLEPWLENAVLQIPALPSAAHMLAKAPRLKSHGALKDKATVAIAREDAMVGVSSALVPERKAVFASDTASQVTSSDANGMNLLPGWEFLKMMPVSMPMGHCQQEELARLLKAAMPSHYEE